MKLYGMEYTFGQFGSSVLTVSPPNLHILNLLAKGAEWETKENLDAL